MWRLNTERKPSEVLRCCMRKQYVFLYTDLEYSGYVRIVMWRSPHLTQHQETFAAGSVEMVGMMFPWYHQKGIFDGIRALNQSADVMYVVLTGR